MTEAAQARPFATRQQLLAAAHAAKSAIRRRTPIPTDLSVQQYQPPPTDGAAGELGRKAREESGIRALQLAGGTGFPQYAQKNLKLRTKAGTLSAFTLNEAQLALNRMAEAQEDAGQPVRQVVLKARQLGISTFIQGRQFYRTTRRSHQSAMTIAHEVEASKNLIAMAHTFYDHLDPLLRPRVKRAGGAMGFPGLGSTIHIATARNLGAGRSSNRQFFHGSEVAFWRDAAATMQGVAQAVAMIPDTEIWLESTAMGPAGYFHTACQQARKGEGNYGFAFLPWFIDKGYVANMSDEIAQSITGEDEDYQRLYHLSDEQMAYRALKIGEFMLFSHSDERAARVRFAQEYPGCPEDAFNADLGDTYIRAASVIRAREAYRDGLVGPTPGAPRVLGVDPSWHGNDSFRVWLRQGRWAKRVGQWKGLNTVQSTARLMSIIKDHEPDVINVDAVGVGAGVYDQVADHMDSQGVPGIVYAIMAGSTPDDEDRFVLKRDECWGRLKEWLVSAPQVALDDLDAIQADLTAIKTVHDVRYRTKLESKDQMRKAPRNLPSPDDGDALSLTFAFSDVGTMGRAGVRSSGALNPNRPFSYKVGG